jgi:hypothetical protein
MEVSEDMMRAALALTFVLALAACGGTTTVTVTQTVSSTETVTTQSNESAAAPCLASALSGNFAAIPGSAGAGQIAYRLRLTNEGDTACFVSGFPASQLLDQKGATLPTNLSPDRPGTGTAPRVDLKPGDAATADVRFSPDVPGSTEQTAGACEPTAYTLRLTVGDGTVDAAIVPPTPVCERGSLQYRNLTAAS